MGNIRSKATDSLQYDTGEIIWAQEGHESNPMRRLFTEILLPYVAESKGKKLLDIGCGQGWLCSLAAKQGAKVLGIDPSENNIAAARRQYPAIDFKKTDLLSFNTKQAFDLITAVMVFEHFYDLKGSYAKIRPLLNSSGKLLIIAGDYDKYVIRHKQSYNVEVEEITDGEVATRTDYNERIGIVYDINRTTGRLINIAAEAGFKLYIHKPITVPDWLVKEYPRYERHGTMPIFHLLVFE